MHCRALTIRRCHCKDDTILCFSEKLTGRVRQMVPALERSLPLAVKIRQGGSHKANVVVASHIHQTRHEGMTKTQKSPDYFDTGSV
jgi:hypothetical protein